LPEAITTLSSQELSRMGDKYIRYTEIYRTGKPYFTDKLPGNFKNIGLIFSILPNALVIDIRRNPIAVGMANLRELFSTSITHVKNPHTINHYNKQYTELMEHWGRAMPNKILTINYEDLVEKTELNVKNLLEFCKLPFEDECLKFYTNKRVVKTPSASQVRQPIYTDSLYNWENFERFLPELNC
jgi:hypothetical protein